MSNETKLGNQSGSVKNLNLGVVKLGTFEISRYVKDFIHLRRLKAIEFIVAFYKKKKKQNIEIICILQLIIIIKFKYF